MARRPGAEEADIIVLATRSGGKIRELVPLFAASGLAVATLESLGVEELPEEENLEVAATFEENALLKARYFARRCALPAVADDSGLEVDGLGGAPGVRSKRWAGRSDLSGLRLDDANNELLLSRLQELEDADRTARYVCAAAFCDGGAGAEFVERGEVAGSITRERQGEGGFGYDPYFFANELGKTFGNASAEEKASVSHRARAFRKLLRRLESRR